MFGVFPSVPIKSLKLFPTALSKPISLIANHYFELESALSPPHPQSKNLKCDSNF